MISFLRIYKIGLYDDPNEDRFKFSSNEEDDVDEKRPLMPI